MMTNEEWLEWGRKEAETRKEELAGVQSAEDLKRVQAAVRARYNAAGLTRTDATSAVIAATS